MPELQTTFTTQLTQVVQVLSSILSTESTDYIAAIIQSDLGQIMQYANMVSQLPVWNNYTDIQSIIQGIKDTPMSLVYDAATGAFVSQTAQTN